MNHVYLTTRNSNITCKKLTVCDIKCSDSNNQSTVKHGPNVIVDLIPMNQLSIASIVSKDVIIGNSLLLEFVANSIHDATVGISEL